MKFFVARQKNLWLPCGHIDFLDRQGVRFWGAGAMLLSHVLVDTRTMPSCLPGIIDEKWSSIYLMFFPDKGAFSFAACDFGTVDQSGRRPVALSPSQGIKFSSLQILFFCENLI